MADDIYLSPEEQDERARQWFKDNAPSLAIGIALGLAAVVGYNKYKDNVQDSAESASALFQQTVVEIRDSELSSIDEQIATLKSDHASSSYASKAMLLKAKQTAVNDLPAAFDELQWVLDNAPESGLKHTARVRQAKIKLALNELDAAKTLAAHSPSEGFESHYQELLGDIAVREGNESQARAHYQGAIDALDNAQDNYAQVLTFKMDRLAPAEIVEVEESPEAPTIETPAIETPAIETPAIETPDINATGS